MNTLSDKPKVLSFSAMPSKIDAELRAKYELLGWHDADLRRAIEAELNDIRGVITGGAIGLSSDWFARLPALEHVAVFGIGTDKVDLAAAQSRNISVSTTPDVLTEDVADLGLGLLIATLRQTSQGSLLIRDGEWSKGAKPALGRSLKRTKLGIVGMGQIGRALARRAQACGMDIGYWNRSPITQDAGWHSKSSVLELADASDVLAICISFTPETVNLVDNTVIKALGRDGYIINIARGGIVNESDLFTALKQGQLAGAASDVFAVEPNSGSDWAELTNFLATPHIGSATLQARLSMGRIVIDELDSKLK